MMELATQEKMKGNNKAIRREINEGLVSDNVIDTLTNEIVSLKKVIADKNYIIDDLVLERDQISDGKYALRIKYETTQQQLMKATGRIKDLEHERTCLKKEINDLNNVANREEILKLRRREDKKTPEASGKLEDLEKDCAVLKKEIGNCNNKILRKVCKKIDKETREILDAGHVDSGISIDMESLNHEIERKIEAQIDEKLNQKELLSNTLNSCEELLSPKTSTKVIEKYPTNREADTRERNIIIHGLKEDGISDQYQIKEILAATITQYTPMSMFRLGPKKAYKNRPILLRMHSTREKEEFMSKLWMLKNVKMKFKNLSVTNDYSLDERKMIKKYVEEANKRNTTGTKGYLWKVRGTPKEGMRIIKIAKQE